MAKQSNIEKVANDARKEQLIKNTIQKTKPYSEDHELAKSSEDKPQGKGTESHGHLHSIPQPYNELTKNTIKGQLDIENGGGSYDIKARKSMQQINLYGPENRYSADLIDLEGAQIFQ